MISDNERRKVAARLRKAIGLHEFAEVLGFNWTDDSDWGWKDVSNLVADLIEPSYKPDAEYEAWYNNLSHFGDEQGGPSTIRELIEDIVWTALTVDLGPNGNTDPSTGIDEGDVYTNKLFAEWESEALLLSGGCDRDALLGMEDEIFESATGLALISELEEDADLKDLQTTMAKVLFGYARRIREACGEEGA